MSAMTATPTMSVDVDPQVDTRGYAYDTTWVDGAGVSHYRSVRALGVAGGPATWSDAYFVNTICGDHLAAKCRGCHRCLDCVDCTCP